VIVLLPGFFAAYLAPRGNALVREMLVGLRLVVLGTAAVAFGAAATLALKPRHLSTTVDWWHLLAYVALALSVLGLASLLWVVARGSSVLSPYWRRRLRRPN
jgi:hypothetical protein